MIWPDFDPSRIVYEDDAVIAVDKPSGVPSQASTEEARDDVVERLRRHLAARDRVDPKSVYLGVHQRLDRATSGVLLYAKKKEANRSLAAQFEGRSIDKRYVAAVAHFPKGAKRRTLRHRLAPGEEGRMVVVPARDRRGQDAVTHVEEIERNGDRALLELRLETGRTHQARAQLEAEHSPIAGDRLYGDRDEAAAAPRLLLHARSIALRHPITDRPLSVRAEVPRAFGRWLAHGDRSPLASTEDDALEDAIDLAREDRFALGRSDDTTAFRLLNEAGDGVPGVAVDVYGDHLVAHFYDDDAIREEVRVLDALASLGFAGIYVKRRPKQANTLVDTRTEALAPSKPLRGTAAEEELEIREHGLAYLARLGDGLSTGIFLDQRENRRRVRELSGGKRVLNLFAYTCPFTIAAAAGGASRTVSVDASRVAIDRGARGLEHAGLAGDHHELLVEDVYAYLDRAKKKHEKFDLVILDPPSYSSVGASRFSTSSDYRPLAAKAMALVAPGGRLLACSNHRQTVRAKLRRWLHEAAREAVREVTQMKDLPAPIDFPPPWGREHHLKSVLVRLA